MNVPRGLIGICLLGALLSACLLGCASGGDDTAPASERSAPASSEPLTKSQFIKRASEICQNGQKEKERRLAKEGVEGYGVGNSRQKLAKLVDELVIPIYGKIVSELASLSPPAGDDAALRIVRRYKATLKDAETQPATQLMQKDPFVAPNAAAARYGIEGCAL